jgi:hypothetical protein
MKIEGSDPLVRGMDPWIRIRIHTKMSWIRNTGSGDPKTFLMNRSNFAVFVISFLFSRDCHSNNPVLIAPQKSGSQMPYR